MKILFDAQGGDNAPLEIIKGAIEAREEFNIDIALIGSEEDIKSKAAESGIDIDFEIINATEKIENTDDPAMAIRRKKDSAIVKGLSLLSRGEYDAFLSCGSTGALLAGGLFIVKRINNVSRAVLPTFIPNLRGNTLVIDSGANMDCDEKLIFEFAKLGKVYLESLGYENPKVGLLNVGVEEGKGNNVTKACYKLLKDSNLNFIGNVEARDVSFGVCDLVVCDGFTGNVLLKNTEGVAMFLVKTFQKLLEETNIDKNESKLLIAKLFKSLDYQEVGGVILLGLNKIVVKAHGSSDAKAVKNATKSAIQAQDKDIIKKLSDVFMEEVK
ncbi:Phosphate acyltransferase [Peptoniphilus sp. ING2-D1G]|nr:Phosphate acyltransferase [Peptoniphilus sp. ING2-D1G]